jgi:TonB-linked SusC/RagA family outer membrane protein
MIKQFQNISGWAFIFLLMLTFNLQNVLAQTAPVTVTGKVLDSGSGLPLKQVSISVASTGVLSETNENGEFSIAVPNLQAELIIELPGYAKRTVFLLGRSSITVSIVLSEYKSIDKMQNSPLGSGLIKDATNSITTVYASEMKNTHTTSFEQPLQGVVPGLQVVEQSGMPGMISYMNIGGISTLYGSSEPLIFIDGMIHDYNYAKQGLMEGYSINPLDVVDFEDITDISVIRNGNSYLGAMSSNGIIYVNTEQKGEASTVIQLSAYGGIGLVPQKLDVLNSGQFTNYFKSRLAEDGYDGTSIDQLFPWLNGNAASTDYYKYANNTDWQSEIYKPGSLSKFHLFLKGGDDIATYNISAGYLSHKGIYEESGYSRFNLRINGKINISDKFSITPNVKLSLGDTYTPNQGYSLYKNPTISALLIPSTMQPYERDPLTGEVLPKLDREEEHYFNASNPVALATNAIGTSRNYNFLSSVKAEYKISSNLIISNLTGINYNNSRENIFLPDIGVVRVDSAQNSPGVFINEFRSTQNHTSIDYTKASGSHSWKAQAGMRVLMNSYKFNTAISLNTPSDDFKKLKDGAKYNHLRTSLGDDRTLSWMSYYANVDYNFRNKYYLNVNASYDANSANNEKNRYNLFPSVGAAWRLSSEKFLSSVSWIDDLKLRALWAVSGNMYSSVYDYSKMYYVEERLNNFGSLTREVIPNNNLEMEKKMTLNGGIDLSLFRQTTNIHINYFSSQVNNLIIEQELPASYGYTTYYDNGGKLAITGLEIGIDQRFHFGDVTFSLGATLTNQQSVVNELTFIKADKNSIITEVVGASYITKEGSPVNAFWGYKTNGIFTDNNEAAQFIGPKGVAMKAGDIRFDDVDGNKIINSIDKQIIGDPNPDFFGGVTAALSYKNFEFSALFTYSMGNEVFNYVRSKTEAMDTYSNQSVTVLDRWTTSNTSATMPRAAIGDPSGNAVFSDRWIEDGSYFGLKKLTVSYTLPQTGFSKGVTLYLTASNLFTSTAYSGYDPQFMYSNSPFTMGIDYGKIPHSRSFIFGVKLDL